MKIITSFSEIFVQLMRGMLEESRGIGILLRSRWNKKNPINKATNKYV